MQRGHISYLITGRFRQERIPNPKCNDCPPGSDCAKAAIERVKQALAAPVPKSQRFVHKTGRDE